jgi:hypothetical protein
MKSGYLVLIALILAVAASNVLAVTKEGGLVVETTKKAASGADCAVEGDSVVVHYTGRLKNADGKIFDSSRRNGQPFEFTLGRGSVIAAWEVGVEGMCVGETRTILAPPAMAYGDQGYSPVIPPKATLWFEVELLTLIPGAGHPRSISFDQVLILLPLFLVIVAISYFGYRILQSPDKGKPAKKGKKQ